MGLDRFSRPLAGEKEPKAVARCMSCDEVFFEGEQVVTWTEEDELFCDEYCFNQYMDVRKVFVGER